jgi:putative ABC transport system permease protein
LAYTAQQRAARSNEFNTHVVARLKPGIDLRQADADVESILRRFRERYADQYPASILQRVGVVPLEAEVTGSMRSPLAILMGAVGLVLLIACANVAHLMLVRLGNRRREFAVRTALGADRSRLVRQLLTETVMVGVLGGVAGLGIAAVGVKLVVALRPGDIPRLADSHLDLVVFGFTLLLSVLTGVLVGIVPALLASRTPLGEVLKTGQRARGREQGRRTGWLVVAEVSLAVILLVGAGLLVRSFINATRADTGMASDGVLFARVYPQAAKYLTGAEVDRFYQGLMDRLGALLGVQGVAVTSNGAGEMWNGGFMIEDNARQGDRTLRGARAAVVSPGYFKTLGIPLRRGRAFAEQDRRPIPTVAVINEAMANRYWPRQDPVGKRLAWGAPDNGWLTVIGVVGDAKRDRLDEEVQPAVYVSYLEYNGDTTTAPIRSMVLALRTAGDPLALVPSLRVSLASIDPDMPVDGVRSIKQLFAESLAPRRFSTLLISVFGLTALALAAIGLYGVVSYSVVQRVPEIGVRMALGASAKDVIRMIVGQGLGFTAIGVVVGAILAVPVSSLVARLLFGVGRLDLITFAGTALVLLGAALIAAYLPARRAARIDPMSALRSE